MSIEDAYNINRCVCKEVEKERGGEKDRERHRQGKRETQTRKEKERESNGVHANTKNLRAGL